MASPNELRVFISSTFRDLQEEREHLVKKIFPEIRTLCRERGITFTDIDLRWGLTEEEAMLGRVIRTCLEEVDKCRPYFIGMIGNRYGWAPELHEVLMDPELLAKYPRIEELAIEGASVTEMEFVHGVFDAPQVEGEYAFFYHRAGDLSAADNPERLRALIDRVRSTHRPLREFATVEELGQEVHDDLVRMIETCWSTQETPSALELERRSHDAFAASRMRAYIPNPEHLKLFTAWLAEGVSPLVIGGESGYGKSSLMAYLVEYYRRKNPTALVIEHYVGASQTSGSSSAVMRHIVETIRERFSIDEPLPTKPEELEKSFANWLYRCEHLAGQEGIGVLIAIDAVNQLEESGRRLVWLPKTLPPGVRVMISTTPGESEERLMERDWEWLHVGPVEDERVRQSIVVRYLGEFHKGISPEQVRRVASDEKGSSPLYLRIVAEELRLHGDHETVDEMIAQYTEAGDLLEVFDRMLERMENDYMEGKVSEMLKLLWGTRGGLSEGEILAMTGVSRLELSRVLFALDYHLLRHDGVLGFFHDYLRRAVAKRYLSEESAQWEVYKELAGYFELAEVTVRTTRELVHVLENLGDRNRLEEVLSRIERFTVLWKSDRQEVLRLWSSVEPGGVVMAYNRSLETWETDESGDRASRAQVLDDVATFYSEIGAWREATQLYEEQLSVMRLLEDRRGEMAALLNLARMGQFMGRLDEADSMAREAEQIARDLEDQAGIAKSIGIRGIVHHLRGEYAEAVECYREQERIGRELGDRRNMAQAIGNRCMVHVSRAEYQEALACYDEWEILLRELGDRSTLAHAVSARGNVHARCGEYAEALACYRYQEEIARELGDRWGVASAVGNRGNVHSDQGDLDEALACYQQQIEIAQEMGYRKGIALATCNRGNVHVRRGEFAEALACYQEAESLSRELGDRSSIAHAVGNRGIVHRLYGELVEALVCFQEQEVITRELGHQVSAAISVGNRGHVYQDRGEYAQALACYREAATEHRADGFSHGLTYWLKGTSRILLESVIAAGQNTAPMPEYLAEYIGQATNESWPAEALRVAREHADECVAISEKLSKPDTTFSGRVLLARITAAEGNTETAKGMLHTLLEQASEDEQQAELHYWLWKFSDASADHREVSLQLYHQLLKKTPKHDYRRRIEELTATPSTET